MAGLHDLGQFNDEKEFGRWMGNSVAMADDIDKLLSKEASEFTKGMQSVCLSMCL